MAAFIVAWQDARIVRLRWWCSPDVNGSVINIIINERRIEKEEVHDT